MKKTPLILALGALTLAGAASLISPVLSSAPTEAKAVEGTHVATWDALKDAVKKASEGQVFVLDDNITSGGGGSDRIKIDGKNLTIDFNGYSVNRNRSKADSDGHAFEIQGDSTVTLTNSAASESFITGGYAKNGGAINIHDGSTLTLRNITLYKNKASDDGGAILNKGTLFVDNCVFRENEAEDDGGAIYDSGKSRYEIVGSTFVDNVSENDGGALLTKPKYDSTIRNTVFRGNRSKTEDGGAISFESNVVLSIYDSYFSENSCEDYGGAINTEDGTLRLYGTSLYGNSGKEGGAIYFDKNLEIVDYDNQTVIENNYASVDGGAIYNNGGTASIGGASITNNTAKMSGGALRLKGGTTHVNGTAFTKNKTVQNTGGAIYLGNKGTLNINSAEFTDNSATTLGGAIYVDDAAKALNMQGEVKAYQNAAASAPNVYLEKGKVINVTGSLAGSIIGVNVPKYTGVITSGYASHNEVAPSNYFMAQHGYAIQASANNEAEIVVDAGGVTPVDPDDPYNLYPFVSKGHVIDTNVTKLGGNNWLSGISGSRYLNEINIPGTHDTSMRSVGTEAGIGSTAGYGKKYAITQKRYIREQFEQGVRYLDIRLNNRVVTEENTWSPNEIEDDGVHLWQVHGKQAGGTYWAEDEDGNLIHLGMVLDWTREFLERNPSEFMIMGFEDETYYDKYVPVIYERLRNILLDYSAQYPDLFYFENGDFSARYTYMPQVKDVRGKILIEVDGGYGIGGFHNYKMCKTEGQSTSYKVEWDEKVDDVNDFFKNHQISLPRDGGAWEHAGTLYKIGLNCAPQSWTTLPWGTPIYHSDRVLERLFFRDSGAFSNIQGKYVGWIKTDGATEREWGIIWRSNFFHEDSDYVTVTVDPNLDDARYQIKQYVLFKNTEINVPDFNYAFDEQANSKYFLGWKHGDQTYFPGAPAVISEDMTFSAAWSDTPTVKNSVIDIVFNDCDNADGLRPTQLDLTINGSTVITLTSAANWHIVYGGVIASIVPDWDLITGGGQGTDGPNSYRYEVSGDYITGYKVTLIHTNTTQMVTFADASSVAGSITWNDGGDYDKTRALTSMVQVGIRAAGTDEFVESSLVEPSVSASDSNVWEYEITNTSVPKYRDGVLAQYELGLKTSASWLHLDKYEIRNVDYDFTAYHGSKKTYLTVRVRWADNEDAGRPESIKVHIYADGNEVDVEPLGGTDPLWLGIYEENYYRRAAEYAPDNVRIPYSEFTIEVTDSEGNPIEGYETPVITKTGANYFDVFMLKPGVDLTDVDAVIDMIDNLGEVTYTPEYQASLSAAKTAYDNLDQAEQTLINNIGKLETLQEEYDEKFAHLIDLDQRIAEVCETLATTPCSKMNDVLRPVTSDVLALEDEERNSLWNLRLLNDAVMRAGSIAEVYNKIDELGDAVYSEDYKTQLDAAIASYEALSDEDKALVDNYEELALAEADYFAKSYIALTDTACGTGAEGDDHSAALNLVYGDLSQAWDNLSDTAKEILKAGVAEDAIEDFFARYSHIVGRYGNDYAFTDGPVVQHVGYHGVSNATNMTMPIALTAVLTISAVATAGLFLARRKKQR